MKKPDLARATAGVAEMLGALGLSKRSRELVGTPERVARLFADSLAVGYAVDVPALLASHVVRSRSRSLVTLRNIPLATTCPHHLMPAWGHAMIAFAPKGRILGLGAITEAVHAFSRRLALQEEISENVASAIFEAIAPEWAFCRVQLVHGCMVAKSEVAAQIAVETMAQRGPVPAYVLSGAKR